MTDSSPPSIPPLQPWLVRIADTFAPQVGEILAQLGAENTVRLGEDYYLIKTARPERVSQAPEAAFLRWNLPVQHMWPCQPQRMTDFIEIGRAHV